MEHCVVCGEGLPVGWERTRPHRKTCSTQCQRDRQRLLNRLRVRRYRERLKEAARVAAAGGTT